MVLRYEKFFESVDVIKSRIKTLNQIKDIFLDVEDRFGLSFRYEYYHFDKHNHPKGSKGYNYYKYNESGSMIDKFYTGLYAPNGYFIIEAEQSFEVISKRLGPEFFELVHMCLKRILHLIKGIAITNDRFHINITVK